MDKPLIHNPEVERLVLGTLMGERDALASCGGILTEDCFYDPVNRAVYRAIAAVSAKGDRPDMPTVMRRLQADKVEVTPYELAQVSGNHTFDLAQHARYLSDLAARRKFAEVAALLADNSTAEPDDVADVVARATSELSALLVASTDHLRTVSEGLADVYDTMCRNMQGDASATTGIPTGFRAIDKRCGGLQPSDFVVIAGETSQGKTSLALSIVYNLAMAGRKAAVYSLEMNLRQLCARFASMASGVPSREIMYGRLDTAQYQLVSDGIGRIEGMEVYVDEGSTSSVESITASMRYLRRTKGVEVFVVDYLQLVSARVPGNKEQQTAYVARSLKNAAKELDATVIALSQLSRNRDNPQPTLPRLRDSGQIEEAADLVMLVYRPEAYRRSFPEPFDDKETQGYAMVDVAKGRNTGVFSFLCAFDAPTTHFTDVRPQDVPTAGLRQSNEKDMPF